jgi:hypothetical protein
MYTAPDPMHGKSVRRGFGPQAYAYANGNPLKNIDPLGLLAICTSAEIREDLRDIGYHYESWLQQTCSNIGNALWQTVRWWAGQSANVCADLAEAAAEDINSGGYRCCEARTQFWTPVLIPDTAVTIWCRDCEKEKRANVYNPYVRLSACF